MNLPEDPVQFSRADLDKLAQQDPALVVKAMNEGHLVELMQGRDPGSCPTCGRPNSEGVG